MANITWDDVVAFAAEAAAVPEDAQNAILDYLNHEALDASNFGGEDSHKYRMARIYLAAHAGILVKRSGGAAGPVTSSSAGRLSRSFAVISSIQSGSGYESTSYGVLYKQLLATTPARLGTVA